MALILGSLFFHVAIDSSSYLMNVAHASTPSENFVSPLLGSLGK